MPIEFAQFPANWKQPLYWVEIDPSMAGLPTNRQPCLLVGQKLPEGKAPVNIPIPIGTLAQAVDQFGAGSMLARMFDIFMRNNVAHEMYGLAPPDPVGAVKASGTITVTSAPTEAGTIHLYIGGMLVPVVVTSTDSAAQVATKILAAIEDDERLPVTATIVSGSTADISLTCKWPGQSGNDIILMDSYKGTLAGERLPTGLVLTYSNQGKLTGGAGVPIFDDAIAALADEAYEYVALPYNDGTSIDAWDAEYGFSDTGRWGWMRQAYGLVFSAYRGDYATTITWGQTNNSGTLSWMTVEPTAPSPIWEWASAYCAKAARALLNDPARPLQTLELTGISGARKHERWTVTELNNFAGVGIATQHMGPNHVPQIQRETTGYQLNLYGHGDDAYELVTTLATLARLIRNQRHAITSKYPRHKLADDGTRFGVGQKIVTPSIIKAELVAQYRIDEFNGLVENVRAFKANLQVERDPNDPNRVNVLYPPDLINQLRIFAVLAQFRLQYDRGIDTAIAA
jgi:phage tail sheath gpL-like